MFEGIVGHTKQIELLSKALKNNKLAHAYVFAGPESMGKKMVARALAQVLLSENSPSLSLRDISPKGGE
jgi:DNA polymerase-3 subunit delta'